MTVSLIPNAPLTLDGDDDMPGRSIIDQPGPAWTGFALMEWELNAAEWTDRHPHDEVNYVLEGELHVESEGETVVAGPGDTVVVPAGSWRGTPPRGTPGCLRSTAPTPTGGSRVTSPSGGWTADAPHRRLPVGHDQHRHAPTARS